MLKEKLPRQLVRNKTKRIVIDKKQETRNLARVYSENRKKILPELKDKAKLKHIIDVLKPEYEYTDFYYSISSRSPAINIYLKVNVPEGLDNLVTAGFSNVLIFEFGKVLFNVIYLPNNNSRSLRQIRETEKHENSHSIDKLYFLNPEQIDYSNPEAFRQEILTELISIINQGKGKNALDYTNLQRFFDRFIRALSDKRNLSFKQQDLLRARLYGIFRRKIDYLIFALSKLPKVQVIRILRSSNWQNFDKELKKAIDANVYI